MNKREIEIILKEHKTELQKKFGVISIGLFGSYARNEEKADSDIDLAVELENPDLFVISSLKNYLQEILGKNVDLVRLRKNMNVLLKSKLSEDVLYI